MPDIPEKELAVAPKALRQALGQVIADLRREWRQERAIIEAEARAAIAEAQGALTAARAELGALKVRHETALELLKANGAAPSAAGAAAVPTTTPRAQAPAPSSQLAAPGGWS